MCFCSFSWSFEHAVFVGRKLLVEISSMLLYQTTKLTSGCLLSCLYDLSICPDIFRKLSFVSALANILCKTPLFYFKLPTPQQVKKISFWTLLCAKELVNIECFGVDADLYETLKTEQKWIPCSQERFKISTKKMFYV